jgi:diacylglycerol kinase (ATP)
MEAVDFLFNERNGKITVFDKGLTQGIVTEPSVRWLAIVSIIGIATALKYETDPNKRFQLILILLLAFVTEIINTSIEAVVDRVGTSFHKLSGYAKDLASTATFIWIIFGLIIWISWIRSQYVSHKKHKNNNKNNTLPNMFNKPMATIVYLLSTLAIVVPIGFLVHYLFNLKYR